MGRNAQKSSLFRLKLNDNQKKMIRQMAQIQINSLMEMYDNPESYHAKELRQIFEIAGKDITDLNVEIADMVSEFDRVVEDPEYVGMMHNDNISLVKHILINFFEDEYKEGNPDYKNIFRQIFINDDREHIFLN